MFWINPKWILQKSPNKYFSLGKTSPSHLPNMFSIDLFHEDSIVWKSGLGSGGAPCSLERKETSRLASFTDRSWCLLLLFKGRFLFLNEHSSPCLVMKQLKRAVEVKQRWIQQRGEFKDGTWDQELLSLWKAASQALKRKEIGWGSWEVSCAERRHRTAEALRWHTGFVHGELLRVPGSLIHQSPLHRRKVEIFESQNDNRLLYSLR